MHILDNVKVLDLTRVVSGPWATQLFADMGATVYKVEPPDEGDGTRPRADREDRDIGGHSPERSTDTGGREQVGHRRRHPPTDGEDGEATQCGPEEDGHGITVAPVTPAVRATATHPGMTAHPGMVRTPAEPAPWQRAGRAYR